MTLLLRAVAYQPNGARLGVLPTPQAVSGSMVFGDVGAFSIDYPQAGPKAAWLAGACEVALEVSYDGGQTWAEPNDARYLRLRRKGDPLERPGVVGYEGPSYLWLLEKSKVLPEGKLNADGKRPFLSATVGTILATLIQEAKARGELPGMTTSSFSSSTDSAGAAWAKVVTLYYEPGTNYLTVLRNLHDQGLVDFTMAGRELKVYRGDTAMAGASGATLLRGRDLTEAPYQGTLEGIATDVFLMGDDGLSFTRNNPAAPAPWGRWTEYISQGGVSDTGTMTVLTDSALALAAEERVENTYGLSFARAKALPFRDYTLGKTVAVTDTAGTAPEALRLRQITLARDERGRVSGNVVLNDRFLENEVRQTRRVQGITGGSTADGGSGARPAPPSDKTIPKAPVGLVTSSDAYQDTAGRNLALVSLVWDPVTENTDGTAADDLEGYELRYRRSGTYSHWSAVQNVGTETDATVSGLEPNRTYDFIVRAFDSSGNRSAWSATASEVTVDDTTAPGKPSTPGVTQYLGQLMVSWDGTLAGGGAPPIDFARAELHLGPSGFSPAPGDVATLLDVITAPTGGSSVATGLAYGTTYQARVILVDRAGNASPASDPADGTPVKMGGIDLDRGVVGFDALAYKQAGNAVPDGSWESAEARATAHMGAAWSWESADTWSGGWALKGDGALGAAAMFPMGSTGLPIPGGYMDGSLGPLTGFRAQQGEKWLVRMKLKRPAAAATSAGRTLSYGLACWDKDGTRLVNAAAFPANVSSFATDWTDLSYSATLPTGTAYAAPFLYLGGPDGAGTVLVDDLEVRQIIGTLLVQDAAITNAKIASVAVDKLTAGAINAAVTVSGRIATALTGARVELNSAGLKAYDSAGLLTVDIPASGGATFGGTVRTATTGARVEVLPVTGGGAVRIYSGYSTESAPGSLSAVVQGSGPTLNGAIYLSSPKRGTYQQATLTLQGQDADGDTATVFTTNYGDVHIVGLQNASGLGGALHFRNGTYTATPWLSIQRTGSGDASKFRSPGGITLDTSANAHILASGSATVQAVSGRVQLIGELTHTSGVFNFTNDYGHEDLRAFVDGTGPLIRSEVLYNRLYTGTANVYVTSATTLGRITSLEAHKVAIDRDWADKASLEAIKALTPASYYDRGNAERYARLVDPEVPDEDADDDAEYPHLLLGLIAEDVQALGLEELTMRDDEGNLAGVAYDRVGVALIPWLRDLEARLARVERLPATQAPRR